MKALKGMAEFYPGMDTGIDMLSSPNTWQVMYADFNSRVDQGGDLAILDRDGQDDNEKEN
jgi:hypothetical protein